MEVVYWNNAIPKNDVITNMIHQYQVQLEGISAIPLDEPEQQHIGYEVGYCAQVKAPNGQCMSPYKLGHVTGITSAQNISLMECFAI